MIPLIIAAIPIEIEPYQEYRPVDWTDVNRAAQLDTKTRFPWWWNKYGCKGTGWYPQGEPCRDLTND